MVLLKGAVFVLAVLIYSVIGLAFKIMRLLFLSTAYFRAISHWTKIFCRFLRSLLNIQVTLEGDAPSLRESGNLIISNHLSYLDGVILGSLFGLIYVSKAQVKSWPLFGWMAQAGGTIFIERGNKGKSLDYIQQVEQMLKRKVNVLVFPEGTSTNGEQLREFQSVHFQSALDAQAAILPLGIRYTKINQQALDTQNRDRICWYGQVKLPEHLFEVLKAQSIEVTVRIYHKVDASNHSSRKDLSESLHDVIAQGYPLFK